MKVTFFSNFLNHHQLPFCLAMERLTDGNFTFVATAQIPKERLALGYADINNKYPFVVMTYNNPENSQKAMMLAKESDIVIIGSAPDKYIVERLKAGKVTFRYSERLHKKGLNLRTIPRALVAGWVRHGRFQKYPVYMLCASAYTAADCAAFRYYMGRTYKWGYFPEVNKYERNEILNKKKNEKVSLLWCGRLINWKHPEAAIHLAKRLSEAGYDFELNIIGNGKMRDELLSMINTMGLAECVHLLGSMSPESVRQHMEHTNIYLFTSDFGEGWGAVLNEAMNSHCAVVASHAIGSVPFLIRNGINGMIYRNGDMDDLFARVEWLINNPEKRLELGENAYLTLLKTWNADVAAERLLALAEQVKRTGSCELFEDGPCSKAGIICNDWFDSDIETNINTFGDSYELS